MTKINCKLKITVSILLLLFIFSSFSLFFFPQANNNRESVENFEELKIAATYWTTTEVVSTESTLNSRHPTIVMDGNGNVYVVWEDLTNYGGSGTDLDIFYNRWNTTSNMWSTTEVVSTETTGSYPNQIPTIVVDSAGNEHVAWHDDANYNGSGTDIDIFYKRWNATSSMWTTTEVVSTESTDDSAFPSIAVDGAGNVHVAWEDWGDYNGSGFDGDILYKRWNVTSSTWTTTEVVSTESTSDSELPTIGVDDAGNIHMAWQDSTDYNGSGINYDIFYKRWNATSSTWTTTEVVSTESTVRTDTPTIAVDRSGNVHIAWEDWGNNNGSGTDHDIFYKRWNATSNTWTTTEVVSTESSGNSWEPTNGVDNAGNVHVVWVDATNYSGSGTDYDIFYKRWNATSNTWATTEVVSTESTSHSTYPTIAVDNTGSRHVVWEDLTNYDGSGTDYDIFYKRLSPLPEISIYTPDQNGFFGVVAPDFNISVLISNLDTMWYTLDDGLTNITFSSLTGTIDQDEWNKQDLGNITIQFYVNDTYGNEGYAFIKVRKEIFEYYTTWGGGSDDSSNLLITDSSGNIYVGGTTASFGAGGIDMVLIKYDNSGTLLWNRTWGGGFDDLSTLITNDSSGNIYVGGTTASFGAGGLDIVLIKYNNSGTKLWNRTWGGTLDETPYGFTLDTSGNIYIVGETWSFGGGQADIFLAKYNSSGTLLWNRTRGGIGRDRGLAVVMGSSETVYVAGHVGGGAPNYDMVLINYNGSSGVQQWNRTWGGGLIDSAGPVLFYSLDHIFITGYTASFGAGGNDMFLVKYNSSGEQQWNRTWGGGGDEAVYGGTLDTSGNIYIVGETWSYGEGEVDMYLVKYTSSGTRLWNRTFGGTGRDRALAVVMGSSETVYIAGHVGGTSNYEMALVKYDGSGVQQWNHTWGGSLIDSYEGLTTDLEGNIYLTGYTASFGAGNKDIILIKYDTATPKISITSPGNNEFIGSIAPSFDISITEPNLYTNWYTLDGGITNVTFSGLIGRISQTEWDKKGDGPVTIRFYSNDTVGNEGYTEVTINKDTLAPLSLISFISFLEQDFVNHSTLFTITSDDGSGSGVSVIRYKINNSAWVDYTGSFDLSSYDYGYYIISYHAIDLVNNIETENTLLVRLVGLYSEPSEQAIPSYNIFLLIGIICVVSVILIKKRNKHKL